MKDTAFASALCRTCWILSLVAAVSQPLRTSAVRTRTRSLLGQNSVRTLFVPAIWLQERENCDFIEAGWNDDSIPPTPIWASSSLQEKSGVEILAEADAAAFWRMCPPGLALVSTQRLRLSLERVFLIVTKSLRLGKKSFLRVNRFH